MNMTTIELFQIVKIWRDANEEKQTEVMKGCFLPENRSLAEEIASDLDKKDKEVSYDVQGVAINFCASAEDFFELNRR